MVVTYTHAMLCAHEWVCRPLQASVSSGLSSYSSDEPSQALVLSVHSAASLLARQT